MVCWSCFTLFSNLSTRESTSVISVHEKTHLEPCFVVMSSRYPAISPRMDINIIVEERRTLAINKSKVIVKIPRTKPELLLRVILVVDVSLTKTILLLINNVSYWSVLLKIPVCSLSENGLNLRYQVSHNWPCTVQWKFHFKKTSFNPRSPSAVAVDAAVIGIYRLLFGFFIFVL